MRTFIFLFPSSRGLGAKGRKGDTRREGMTLTRAEKKVNGNEEHAEKYKGGA